MSAALPLFDQRGLGEILAALGQRQLGLLGPALLELVELGDVAAHFLLVGDGAGGRGANLDQRLLHLHDDHADHLRRILRPIEQIGDVGGDDVTGAGENSHGRSSWFEGVGGQAIAGPTEAARHTMLAAVVATRVTSAVARRLRSMASKWNMVCLLNLVS